MLILTRRPGEKLMIGENVEISVIRIYKNQIRLGIEAPENISIHRKEIYLKIKNGEIETRKISKISSNKALSKKSNLNS